jgi:hypothetical protein
VKTACAMSVGMDRVANKRVHDLLKLEESFLTIVSHYDVGLSRRIVHRERVVCLPFYEKFNFGLSQ